MVAKSRSKSSNGDLAVALSDASKTWAPQPGPQTAFVHCTFADEVFFGGARGGGKTDAALGKLLIKALQFGSGMRGIFFRRFLPNLEEVIIRARELFGPFATYKETTKTWTFYNGATVKFRFLDRDQDADNYQGHQYCVHVDTPILMGDGSYLPIKKVRVGDYVQTLEGPRRVTRKTAPYLSECVRYVSRDASGRVVGQQIHPATHPVLSSVESNAQRTTHQLQNVFQRQQTPSPWRSVLPRHDAGPRRRVLSSWLEGGQICCKESVGDNQGIGRLLLSSVPVVLHAPDPLSDTAYLRTSTRRRALCKFYKLSQEIRRQLDISRYDLTGRLLERARQRLDLVASNVACLFHFSTHGACVQHGSHGVLDYQVDYRDDLHSCGELFPYHQGDAQGDAPSRADAATPTRDKFRSDETDCIRERSLTSQSLAYIHPYTGELRQLACRVELGHAEVFYEGFALVSDLTVEGANHYISNSRLVNMNTDIVIEEAGSFPSLGPIMKLKATLRSAKGIPCQLLLTGNPGGPGALWIRARYIDPAPAGWEPIKEVESRIVNGKVVSGESIRIYIPSRLTDNQILMNSDPGYVGRLMQVGSEQLVKAWLDGDFYVVDGAFFDNFDIRKHGILPCELPHWWTRFRACDWGSAKPFCVLWMAHATEDFTHPGGMVIPKGSLVVYREWYGIKTKNDGTIQANVGLKLYAEAVAQGILERDRRDRIDYSVLDPSAFAQDGGASIAERMFIATQGKVAFRRADNKRVGERGALSGWDQVRSRLSGDEGKPSLYFFTDCHHLLRTLPALQHDPDRPEDLDTTAEDHAADALRYGCMSRPYTKPAPPEKARMTSIADVNLDQLWYDREQYNNHDVQRI